MIKVDRAYKHLAELDSEIVRFFAWPYPYEVISQDDLQTGERTFYLRESKPIPLEISALIGDIAHNLISSLDHLAWHLVKNSSIVPKASDRSIYFPIFETASEYRAKKMEKIKGMTDASIEAIDAVQPYYRLDTPGIGNGTALYWLHVINIHDKHRLLIPTMLAIPAHTITKSKRRENADVLRKAFGSVDADVMIPSGVAIGPLEDGGKLCSVPIAEVDDNMRFRFQLSFGDPPGIRGKEIVSTLKNMHRVVKETMTGFAARGLL